MVSTNFTHAIASFYWYISWIVVNYSLHYFCFFFFFFFTWILRLVHIIIIFQGLNDCLPWMSPKNSFLGITTLDVPSTFPSIKVVPTVSLAINGQPNCFSFWWYISVICAFLHNLTHIISVVNLLIRKTIVRRSGLELFIQPFCIVLILQIRDIYLYNVADITSWYAKRVGPLLRMWGLRRVH